MGLISFVKSAGAKLFGASEAKAATVDDLQKECETWAGHVGVKIPSTATRCM